MIVITAPTGNIGSQVLANILDSEERIRVIARDPSKLAPQALNRVEVIEGSHRDSAVVAQAFEGADRVFWLVPADLRAPIRPDSSMSATTSSSPFALAIFRSLEACEMSAVFRASAAASINSLDAIPELSSQLMQP